MKSIQRTIHIVISLVLLVSFLLPIGVSAKEIAGETKKTEKASTDVSLSTAEQHDDIEYNGLSSVIDQLRSEYGLTDKNFSMSYYLTDGSLQYNVAEDVLRRAASTYKLPLNMYYYDMEREGTISPTARIRGYSLEQMHRRSLVYSDNAVSQAMMANLGTYRHYRELMAGLVDQKCPEAFYGSNVFSSSYMIAVLKRLYQNRDQYREMIGYMREASPGEYFKRGNDDVVIAHKYGSYQGAVNDVGIIYTEVPFLLAVYTQNVKNADVVLGELAGKMTEYTRKVLENRKILVNRSSQQAEIRLQTMENHLTEASNDQKEENEDRLGTSRDRIRTVLIGLILLWVGIPLVRGVRNQRKRSWK